MDYGNDGRLITETVVCPVVIPNHTETEGERLVIIGSGGHARAIYDSVNPLEFNIVGFVDDYRTGSLYGKPIFGSSVQDVPEYKSCKYIIGIGDCYIRKKWYLSLKKLGLKMANVIDGTAVVSDRAKIGEGNYIGKCAVINAGCSIGCNNIINSMALLEHESSVGNHTNISTRSTVNGDTVIEDGTFIGSGATLVGQLKIGKDSVIGAGSVVIRNVDAGCTVAGVPARIIKSSEECL